MKSLTLSLLVLIVSAAAMAESVYVAPIKGTGVAKSELEALRELIIANVQSGDHSVVEGASQADATLQTKLIKFSSYTLTMTKWEGNSKVNSGQWKASNSAELENATQKAVTKMMGGKRSMIKGNSTTLGEQVAMKQKNQTSQRVAANRQVLLGFGPSYFNNMNNPDTGLALLLGYYWNINDNVDLGLQTDVAFSTEESDTNMITAKIMANYFPVLWGDTSPYLGAGFGYGYASAHDGSTLVSDQRANGFAGSLQAGLKFFRTSSVNLGVGFDYTVIFDKTDFGNPSRLIFKVGLYY